MKWDVCSAVGLGNNCERCCQSSLATILSVSFMFVMCVPRCSRRWALVRARVGSGSKLSATPSLASTASRCTAHRDRASVANDFDYFCSIEYVARNGKIKSRAVLRVKNRTRPPPLISRVLHSPRPTRHMGPQDGVLSGPELIAALRSLGCKLDPTDAQRLLLSLDRAHPGPAGRRSGRDNIDGGGGGDDVRYSDFLRFVARHTQRPPASSAADAVVHPALAPGHRRRGLEHAMEPYDAGPYDDDDGPFDGQNDIGSGGNGRGGGGGRRGGGGGLGPVGRWGGEDGVVVALRERLRAAVRRDAPHLAQAHRGALVSRAGCL